VMAWKELLNHRGEPAEVANAIQISLGWIPSDVPISIHLRYLPQCPLVHGLDLTYAVVPLFHKMSKNFDESGAHGTWTFVELFKRG